MFHCRYCQGRSLYCLLFANRYTPQRLYPEMHRKDHGYISLFLNGAIGSALVSLNQVELVLIYGGSARDIPGGDK